MGKGHKDVLAGIKVEFAALLQCLLFAYPFLMSSIDSSSGCPRKNRLFEFNLMNELDGCVCFFASVVLSSVHLRHNVSMPWRTQVGEVF